MKWTYLLSLPALCGALLACHSGETADGAHAAADEGSAASSLPDPTAAQLRGLEAAVQMLDEVPEDVRGISALTGLMTASRGRVPAQFADDLLAYNNAQSEQRHLRASEVFAHSEELFNELCDGAFREAMVGAAELDERAKIAVHVWKSCELGRHELIAGGEAQLAGASERAGLDPLFAHFIYAYLEEHGGAHPLERQLLVEIAKGPQLL